MKILRLAFTWAVTGSIIGVAVWSIVGGIVWSLDVSGGSFALAWKDIPFIIAESSIWAAFIGLAVVPLYAVVFAVWLTLAHRFPAWTASRRRQLFAAFGVSLPAAIILAHGFGSSPVGFNWHRAMLIFPLALLSFFCGVWQPRRWIPSLR